MHVLVVDDNAELIELVSRALTSDGHRVSAATNISQAQTLLANDEFSVIVLDVGLPDGSGIALCRAVRSAEVPTPILMLTAHAGVSERVEGLDAGADDFMGKPFAVAELRARVRALGRRKGQPLLVTWSKDGVQLDFSKRNALVHGRDIPLTTREWAIMSVLVNAKGRVVSQSRLLEDIWGDESEAARASLEVLVGRIRKKLGDALIRTVRGEGYAIA